MRDIAIPDLLEHIRGGTWAGEVESLRQIRARDPDRYNTLKTGLRAVSLSCACRTRSRAEPMERRGIVHSGLLQIDVDGLDDPEALADARARIEGDPHVAFCFLSPSGAGLKAGLRIDPERHAESFQAAQGHFLDSHRINIDPATRDVLRLCFVSFDPGLYVNPDAIPLPIPDGIAAIAAPELQEPVLAPQPCQDADLAARYGREAVQRAVRAIAAAEKGARHRTILTQSYMLGGYVGAGAIPWGEALAAILAAVEARGLRGETRTVIDGLKRGALRPVNITAERRARAAWAAARGGK